LVTLTRDQFWLTKTRKTLSLANQFSSYAERLRTVSAILRTRTGIIFISPIIMNVEIKKNAAIIDIDFELHIPRIHR